CARFQRSPASDRNDSTVARLSQGRNCRPQNVKYGIQIEVKHTLEDCVVGVRDRLATSETADCVSQNLQLSETGNNLINQGVRAFARRNLRWHRGKVWVDKLRLLYRSRCANDGCTGVEKRLRRIGSQATVGPGYKYNLALHRMLRSHWPSDSDRPER